MNFRNPSSRSTFRNTLVTTLATVGVTLGATICLAADLDPAYVATSKVVAYGDLNLANPKGAQQLYQRIASAAKAVCDSGDLPSLMTVAHDRACVAKAIERAVNAVGRPELTAIYQAHTGRTAAVTLAKR